MERLKFLSITASNLDEFFMIRVASLKDQVNAGYTKRDIAGMTAAEQIEAILKKTHDFMALQYSTYNRSLLPTLKKEGLKIVTEHEKLTKEQSAFVDQYFTRHHQLSYSREEYSFFLGYLSHLLTDQLWVESAVAPLKERYPDQWNADKNALIARAKEVWYDLDFLYIKMHPDFRAFSIYSNAVGF